MKFNLSEVFYSLQGEGPMCGRPRIFVRFSGCNLRCRWGANRCDTPYTSWEPETNLVTAHDLFDAISKCNPSCRELVLTGGEPLLQNGFKELCVELKQRGYRLELETNGTLPAPDQIDLIVCSPKLSDSTPHGDKTAIAHEIERQGFLNALRGDDARLYLKFVVGAKTDPAEIRQVVSQVGVPKGRVYLMPEGLSAEEICERSPLVGELALREGYNFCTRMHLLLWGNARGR